MAERLKIEGNFMTIFENGTPSIEYINEQRVKITPRYNDSDEVEFLVNNIPQGKGGKTRFDCTTIIDDSTGLTFATVENLKTFLRNNLGDCCSSGGGSGIVETVTGDGVNNTDPKNPVLSFPDADEVDDTSTTNKFATQAQLNQIATNTSDIAGKRNTTAQKNSIEDDGGDLQLVGDSASAGNDKYYGTNGTGTKGFYDLPSSSSGVQSVTGDGVGGTAADVVMTFPTPAEIGALDLTTYDPNNVQDDAFDYENFLGTFQVTGTPQTVSMSSDKDNLVVTANNVNLTTTSQDRRITGIEAPAAGVNRQIEFFNQSSQYRIKFVHQSGSSNADNRIVLRGLAGTRNLLQFQTCTLKYNHLLNRWYVTRIG